MLPLFALAAGAVLLLWKELPSLRRYLIIERM
jgi:hypothetical protein